MNRESASTDGARMAALLDAAVDSIVSIDSQGTIQTINNATVKLFGYAADELVGRNVSVLMSEPDRGSHDAHLRRYLETGRKQIIGIGREVVGRRQDGSTFPLWLSVGEAKTESGPLFVGVLRDLSKEKARESAIEDGRRRYQQILDILPVGIMVTCDDHITYGNPALARMLGANTIAELTGTESLSWFHPDYHGLIERRRLQARETDMPVPAVEEELLRRDGTTIPVEVLTAAVNLLGIPSIMVILHDLRERKEIEASFRTMVESVHDYAIYSLDKHGLVTTWNTGAERMTGYSLQEAIGMNYEKLFPDEERKRNIPQKHLEVSAVHGRLLEEGWRVRKDGTRFRADILMTAMRDRNGNVNGFVKVTRDVTERSRIERELRETKDSLERLVAELQSKSDEVHAVTQQLWQAAKLASVGELAASVAHELNNPMATIQLRLESVLSKTPAEDIRRRPLEIVAREIDRMASLVAGLLQFSRRGQNVRSQVHVFEELMSAAELVQHLMRKQQIEVVHEFQADAPAIQADRQKLRQVFLNLLTNACDAMDRGGRLTMRVQADQMESGESAVRIEVSDTGPGIPEDHLRTVMEPFFTTKEEGRGTGLGLAICRRIVLEHNGRMTIDSQVGVGTTVRIYLPVQPAVGV
ncbi:MAG: PAS domain S-box protein [Pirellulaceae bacterium]|nr:PAS domain S-box protein [Pirellulaceae bacterium]